MSPAETNASSAGTRRIHEVNEPSARRLRTRLHVQVRCPKSRHTSNFILQNEMIAKCVPGESEIRRWSWGHLCGWGKDKVWKSTSTLEDRFDFRTINGMNRLEIPSQGGLSNILSGNKVHHVALSARAPSALNTPNGTSKSGIVGPKRRIARHMPISMSSECAPTKNFGGEAASKWRFKECIQFHSSVWLHDQLLRWPSILQGAAPLPQRFSSCCLSLKVSYSSKSRRKR